ncbi:holo-ACP synthase [bacterium]|nr:holo-ACP synthase [bacterium]
MSVIGLGTDIVAVARMAALLDRHGERFLARCFSPEERERIAAAPPAERPAVAAARWAAKEAFLKALGGPIGHIGYRQVAVGSDLDGAPRLVLDGAAADALGHRGGRHALVSLSHEREYAVATVIIAG